jgi:hypothetical protein
MNINPNSLIRVRMYHTTKASISLQATHLASLALNPDIITHFPTNNAASFLSIFFCFFPATVLVSVYKFIFSV